MTGLELGFEGLSRVRSTSKPVSKPWGRPWHLAILPSRHEPRHTLVALLIRYGWQEYSIVRRLGWKDGTML